MEINIRLTVPDNVTNEGDWTDTGQRLGVEEIIVHAIVADVDLVDSAVVLRNDGWGNLLPDESTRQER